jgi:tRNA(Ile)-lysidine synthase
MIRKETPYPSPSPVGGILIRNVIASFKERGFSLPFTEPVFIACSAGIDSMVLAHLIGRYGRRIIDPEKLTLLHFDHGWRPESKTLEPEGVRQLAEQLGLNFKSVVLPTAKENQAADNLEHDARLKRQAEYKKLAGASKNATARWVWTAHHQDDVVETLVWRFFRGELMHQVQGILFHDDPVLRPFLQVTRAQIQDYALAEGVKYFEDASNQDPSRMRAFLRQKLFPLIEIHFPGFKSSVFKYTEHSTEHPSEQKTELK